MKSVAFVCAVVLVIAVAASPAADAQGLQFVGRCDGIQIDSIVNKRIEAQWVHYDCVSNTPMTGGLIAPGLVPNACPGGNGNAVIACRESDPTCGGLLGGGYFFVLDSLDGTLDLNMGDPFGEHTCAIDEMAYTVTGF